MYFPGFHPICKLPINRTSGRYVIIGVRGFPNGIFNPWARWITGLALAENSSVAVVVVAVVVVAALRVTVRIFQIWSVEVNGYQK